MTIFCLVIHEEYSSRDNFRFFFLIFSFFDSHRLSRLSSRNRQSVLWKVPIFWSIILEFPPEFNLIYLSYSPATYLVSSLVIRNLLSRKRNFVGSQYAPHRFGRDKRIRSFIGLSEMLLLLPCHEQLRLISSYCFMRRTSVVSLRFFFFRDSPLRPCIFSSTPDPQRKSEPSNFRIFIEPM